MLYQLKATPRARGTPPIVAKIISYPIPLEEWETWKVQFKFNHIGSAETITVAAALDVQGELEWTGSESMDVTADAETKSYTTPVLSGTFDPKGLGTCWDIDTYLHITDSEGNVYDADSAKRFHSLVPSYEKAFIIYQDRYHSPEGWGAWEST